MEIFKNIWIPVRSKPQAFPWVWIYLFHWLMAKWPEELLVWMKRHKNLSVREFMLWKTDIWQPEKQKVPFLLRPRALSLELCAYKNKVYNNNITCKEWFSAASHPRNPPVYKQSSAFLELKYEDNGNICSQESPKCSNQFAADLVWNKDMKHVSK